MRRVVIGAIVLLCIANACSQNESVPLDTIGVTWTLVEVNESPVDAAAMNRPATLMLDSEGNVSGYAGCNQFGGPYAMDGASLRFGAIAMTRMACPDRMEVETAYAAVFDATRSWRVNEGMLELLADGRVLARFRR